MRSVACLLFGGLINLPLTGAVAGDQTALPADAPEAVRLVQIAKEGCARLNAPVEGRRVTITADEERAIVIFHLPEKMRGGDFIIQIDRHSGKVLDKKIWR